MKLFKKKELTRVDIIFDIVIFLIVASIVAYMVWKGVNTRNYWKEHQQSLRARLEQTEMVLIKAVDANNPGKISKILKENDEIIKHSYSGDKYYSILHYAVNFHKDKAIEELLKAGYNPDVQDNGSQTPLSSLFDINTIWFLSRENSHKTENIADLFLEYNASPDISDYESTTPLICSIIYLYTLDDYNFSIPKLLVEKGKCDINHLDRSGHSAVYYSFQRSIQLAHYLIVEHKADVTNDPSIPQLLQDLNNFMDSEDSEEYRLMQEIIQEMKNQGVDVTFM